MPTTRRSTGGTRARPGPGKGQSTISFSNKVTKNVPRDIKKAVIADSPLKKVEVAPEPEEEEAPDVAADEGSEQEAEAEVEEPPAPSKSEAEERAEKITDAQINRYWKKIEAERIAPRVHQRELDVPEKVLRYFDVSSQYGVSLLVNVCLRCYGARF